MNKPIYAIIVIVLIIAAFSIGYGFRTDFSDPPDPNIQFEGVFGKVTLTSGNCMPTPGGPNSCSIEGASRKIFIREVVLGHEYMNQTYLKSDAPQSLIKTGQSDTNGNFRIELPPGKYSIFVEDDGKEFCNSYNGEGNCIIEINANQSTEFNPDISIYAAY